MLKEKLLEKLLTKKFKLTEKDIIKHKKRADKLSTNLETFLIDEDIVDEADLYSAAAKLLKNELTNLKGKEIKKEILNLIPAPLAQAQNVVAFDRTKTTIRIAMLDPSDIQTIEFIQRKTGLTPKVFLTTPTDIKDAIHRYHADLESDFEIKKIGEKHKTEAGKLKKEAEELPIINIVNSVLEHAVFEGASDIHIEPAEKDVIVRYRIDGVLKNVMTLPKKVREGITARIKILANLKIDEHMIPQDGRFKIDVGGERLAFRVSIMPVYEGEKVVMRLLHEGQKPLSLDQLGFLKEPKSIVEEAIGRPHGIILVTGPTGSGKTTTLYSLLGILNKPHVNISTIEDPIEYHVKGINQSQINTKVGFDFATGLRAFLRQDPDIIMVGEIRDKETAEIAIHAAMTGHLVLSTLHTNDAPTTLPRLTDMGIPPFLVSFTANIVIAQRLVRRVCEHCKIEYHLESQELKQIERIFDTKKMIPLFKEQKIKLGRDEKALKNMIFHRGTGCRRCSKSGYKGRVGIYEVMQIDNKIAKKINEKASASQIGRLAKNSGMLSMLQDGLIKAKQGITTIEEVLRVTR